MIFFNNILIDSAIINCKDNWKISSIQSETRFYGKVFFFANEHVEQISLCGKIQNFLVAIKPSAQLLVVWRPPHYSKDKLGLLRIEAWKRYSTDAPPQNGTYSKANYAVEQFISIAEATKLVVTMMVQVHLFFHFIVYRWMLQPTKNK